MKTHTGDDSTCTNDPTCTHPDHVADGVTTCEDRAVGCRSDCPCCVIPAGRSRAAALVSR